MPADRINFYENQNEASMRLRKTVVLYDGEPYYVIGISDHKNDGKLRIYLDKIGYYGLEGAKDRSVPNYFDLPQHLLGQVLDEWIQNNPDKGIVRKFLGAAGFNKFRPFPLGNVNIDGQVVYAERTPTRNPFQGLRQDAIVPQIVSVAPNRDTGSKRKKMSMYGSSYGRESIYPVDIFHPSFYDCVMGNYPTFEQVVEGLRDPEVLNTGVAFHREFSVLRGPLDILVLCYKTEGVGIIDTMSNGGEFLTLSKDFLYLKETLEELGIFASISVQEKF